MHAAMISYTMCTTHTQFRTRASKYTATGSEEAHQRRCVVHRISVCQIEHGGLKPLQRWDHLPQQPVGCTESKAPLRMLITDVHQLMTF